MFIFCCMKPRFLSFTETSIFTLTIFKAYTLLIGMLNVEANTRWLGVRSWELWVRM